MAGPGIRSDVARVNKRLAKFSDEVAGKPMADRLRTLGRELQRDAAEAVRRTPSKGGWPKPSTGSLADGSMSGWHRSKPVELNTRITLRHTGGRTSVLVTPDRTAGLWRVLESGREGRAKGDRVARGVTRKGNVRMRRVKRNTGATEGKGTWTKASAMMVARSRREFTPSVQRAFRKTFGG